MDPTSSSGRPAPVRSESLRECCAASAPASQSGRAPHRARSRNSRMHNAFDSSRAARPSTQRRGSFVSRAPPRRARRLAAGYRSVGSAGRRTVRATSIAPLRSARRHGAPSRRAALARATRRDRTSARPFAMAIARVHPRDRTGRSSQHARCAIGAAVAAHVPRSRRRKRILCKIFPARDSITSLTRTLGIRAWIFRREFHGEESCQEEGREEEGREEEGREEDQEEVTRRDFSSGLDRARRG